MGRRVVISTPAKKKEAPGASERASEVVMMNEAPIECRTEEGTAIREEKKKEPSFPFSLLCMCV